MKIINSYFSNVNDFIQEFHGLVFAALMVIFLLEYNF
jgi:hypothetical protein